MAWKNVREVARAEHLRALILRDENDLVQLMRNQDDPQVRAGIQRLKRNLARNKKALAGL